MIEPLYRVWVEKNIIESHPAKMYPVVGLHWKPDKLEVEIWEDLKPLDILSTEFCELMQYSTLLDVNKKRICVGDIVKAPIHGTIKHNWEVRFDFAEFYLYREWPSDVGKTDFATKPLNFTDSICEVIGNIWENHSLLEEQQ